MVRVNLIGKKRNETKSKSVLIVLSLIFYVSFLIYFFGSTIYVVYKLTSIKMESAKVEQQTQLISKEILANNELLNRYVLSKFILGKIISLNSEKFRYKDYLDQVVGFLPVGSNLEAVSFSIKDWVSVSVSVKNLTALKMLEQSFTDKNKLSQSMFSDVFSESVSKSLDKGYLVKLQFQLRKNGTK